MAGVKGKSGRPKGSLNHTRIDVSERLAALDCKPLDGMVRIAKKAEENDNLQLAGKMYSEIIKYILPQLKAVEHSGSVNGQIIVQITGDDAKI